MFALIRAAIVLPIDELNYSTSSDEIRFFSYVPGYRKRGLLLGMLAFIVKCFLSLLNWRPQRANVFSSNRTTVLIVQETLNQAAALDPIRTKLSSSLTLNLHHGLSHSGGAAIRFPDAMAHLFSVPFWPFAIRAAFAAKGYARVGYRYVFHTYWLTYGYYLASRHLLRQLKPSIVLLANDHNMRTRVLERAARDEGICRALIQHASASAKFPPLAFDLAFLDGADALVKYDRPGSEGCIAYLTGIAKSDLARQSMRDSGPIHSVGICPSLLDSVDLVTSVVNQLKKDCPHIALSFRPHPSDKRDWGQLPGIRTSDANEHVFDFLSATDAIVTGHSNIALEAALVGSLPIFFDFSKSKGGEDPYGFLASGLVVRAHDAHDLVALIREREAGPNVVRGLSFYHATAGTEYDGRSAELVAQVLEEHLKGGIRGTAWVRIPTEFVEAYALATA